MGAALCKKSKSEAIEQPLSSETNDQSRDHMHTDEDNKKCIVNSCTGPTNNSISSLDGHRNNNSPVHNTTCVSDSYDRSSKGGEESNIDCGANNCPRNKKCYSDKPDSESAHIVLRRSLEAQDSVHLHTFDSSLVDETKHANGNDLQTFDPRKVNNNVVQDNNDLDHESISRNHLATFDPRLVDDCKIEPKGETLLVNHKTSETEIPDTYNNKDKQESNSENTPLDVQRTRENILPSGNHTSKESVIETGQSVINSKKLNNVSKPPVQNDTKDRHIYTDSGLHETNMEVDIHIWDYLCQVHSNIINDILSKYKVDTNNITSGNMYIISVFAKDGKQSSTEKAMSALKSFYSIKSHDIKVETYHIPPNLSDSLVDQGVREIGTMYNQTLIKCVEKTHIHFIGNDKLVENAIADFKEFIDLGSSWATQRSKNSSMTTSAVNDSFSTSTHDAESMQVFRSRTADDHETDVASVSGSLSPTMTRDSTDDAANEVGDRVTHLALTRKSEELNTSFESGTNKRDETLTISNENIQNAKTKQELILFDPQSVEDVLISSHRLNTSLQPSEETTICKNNGQISQDVSESPNDRYVLKPIDSLSADNGSTANADPNALDHNTINPSPLKTFDPRLFENNPSSANSLKPFDPRDFQKSLKVPDAETSPDHDSAIFSKLSNSDKLQTFDPRMFNDSVQNNVNHTTPLQEFDPDTVDTMAIDGYGNHDACHVPREPKPHNSQLKPFDPRLVSSIPTVEGRKGNVNNATQLQVFDPHKIRDNGENNVNDAIQLQVFDPHKVRDNDDNTDVNSLHKTKDSKSHNNELMTFDPSLVSSTVDTKAGKPLFDPRKFDESYVEVPNNTNNNMTKHYPHEDTFTSPSSPRSVNSPSQDDDRGGNNSFDTSKYGISIDSIDKYSRHDINKQSKMS